MERRRLQKWKRVEELRHQDYLIAGGKMESKRRERLATRSLSTDGMTLTGYTQRFVTIVAK